MWGLNSKYKWERKEKGGGSRENPQQLLWDIAANDGLYIFATSRKEQAILEAFADLPATSLNNVKDHVKVDMEAYINEEFWKALETSQTSGWSKGKDNNSPYW